MSDERKLTIKDGVVYAYGLRLLKDPETEARERGERLFKMLERLRELNRRRQPTPEERRAQFKLIQGERT